MIGQRNTSLAAPLAFIALLFLLASCDTYEPTSAPPAPAPASAPIVAEPEPEPAAAEVAQPAPPLPKAKPAEVAAIPAQQKVEAVLPPPPPPPPPEAPAMVKLIGLGEAETLALLGTPYEQREVAPAKVWDYAATGCRLEVFLYLDVASNSFHVLQYRASGDVSGSEASQRCLKRVVDERRG